MNEQEAKALREPFPASQIGKLPRITCGACRDAPTKACQQHRKTECAICGNYISPRHIHLDYVGHAAATDRLLQVDPEWSWEPVATDPQTGAPVLANGGLWIRLTICGVTRLGWGDGSTVKEMIGDAIRNAAMRFGVALDLWAKEDLRGEDQHPTRNTAAAKSSLIDLLTELGNEDPKGAAKALWDSTVPTDATHVTDELWARLEDAARDLVTA